MEETVVNVCLEANETHHHDVTPNQSICKEIKNIAIAAEEISENPNYVVVRKSIAVQTVTNEQVLIPKQDISLNQRPNLIAGSSESGITMEIDVSSQESVMDIASQESLPVKETNSEEHYFSDNKVSFREEAVLVREKAVLEYEEKLKKWEKDMAQREKVIVEKERKIEEHQEKLKIKEEQIADRETAVKIRELEADGYRVIHLSNESNVNSYLPAKRPKKN